MKKLDLDFIKQKRESEGLTFKQVSTAMGFKNPSTYYKYESGKYSFNAHHLPVLAQILKCDPADFFK